MKFRYRYNGGYDLIYTTSLSVAECIARINAAPYLFQTRYYSLWQAACFGDIVKQREYDCIYLSESELQITFKGGSFAKYGRAYYIAEFISDDVATIVHMKFQGTLLFPFPTSPTADIDSFMRERIQGVRQKTKKNIV